MTGCYSSQCSLIKLLWLIEFVSTSFLKLFPEAIEEKTTKGNNRQLHLFNGKPDEMNVVRLLTPERPADSAP
jgi:hypothetical protein